MDFPKDIHVKRWKKPWKGVYQQTPEIREVWLLEILRQNPPGNWVILIFSG